MQNICVVFRVLTVKNDRWMPHLLLFFGGRVYRCNFYLTSGNVKLFYDRNFDYILKIL